MLEANSSDSSLKRTQIKQRKDLGLLPAFRSEPIAYSENVLYTAQLLTIVRLARRLLIVERREEDPTLLNNTVVGKAWLGQSYSTQSANPCILAQTTHRTNDVSHDSCNLSLYISSPRL
jgi:hypothetical protein